MKRPGKLPKSLGNKGQSATLCAMRNAIQEAFRPHSPVRGAFSSSFYTHFTKTFDDINTPNTSAGSPVHTRERMVRILRERWMDIQIEAQ